MSHHFDTPTPSKTDVSISMTSTPSPAPGTTALALTVNPTPARVIIIDDHEISPAAFIALLYAEGIDVTAGLAASDQALTVARPDVAIVDLTPAADTGFAIAEALLALPFPPIVILTSSIGRTHFSAELNGHRFIAKADVCAARLPGKNPQTGGPESPNRRVPRRSAKPRR